MRWRVAVMMWAAALGALAAATPAAAQPAADEPAPLVLAADQPVMAYVNGLSVALALTTGTVDHVTLNDESVLRIGLSAAPLDNSADLVIGGRVVLRGRHGKGWLAQGGPLLRREFYWFPGEQRLPLAGTIGPFALPHWRVRVEWPVPATGPAAEVINLPLVGGIDRAAYGISSVGKQYVAVGVDVRMRRALPLVTAATGADLAATLGGQFVGESWQEEILLGVRRPVRRLQLARPLMIGAIRIDAVAVRQGGPRDATMSLARGQMTPLDAEEDPEVMQVPGRILKQRRVARYIVLSRTQLEAAGCTSLLIDKLERRFRLSCAPPEQAGWQATAQTAAVPVTRPDGPLIEPVLPASPPLRLALGEPVTVQLDDRPLELVPGEAGREGLMLNGWVHDQMMTARMIATQRDQQRRGQLADALRRANPGAQLGELAAMTLPDALAAQAGVGFFDTEGGGMLASMDVQLTSAGGKAQAVSTSLALRGRAGPVPLNNLPHHGRIALATLPDAHLCLQLGPPPANGTATPLVLTIGDRSHDQAVMGVTAVPGIDTLFVGLELAPDVAEPIVSLALGQDLMRLHGGAYAGPVQRWRNADQRPRAARPLQLATPLVVGPLQFSRVLVEQQPALQRFADERRWSRFVPWPDLPGIAGLERELRLPPSLLLAAGCHELEVDKPRRAWTLQCRR